MTPTVDYTRLAVLLDEMVQTLAPVEPLPVALSSNLNGVMNGFCMISVGMMLLCSVLVFLLFTRGEGDEHEPTR